MGDHSVRTDDSPVADGHPGGDGGFGTDPDVVADDDGGGTTTLVEDGHIGLVEGVVVVADGDQLADEAAPTDYYGFVGGHCAMVAEHRPVANREPSCHLQSEPMVKDTSDSESNRGTPGHREAGPGANVATRPEGHPRMTKPGHCQAETTT